MCSFHNMFLKLSLFGFQTDASKLMLKVVYIYIYLYSMGLNINTFGESLITVLLPRPCKSESQVA